jgi:hypothetical protein
MENAQGLLNWINKKGGVLYNCKNRKLKYEKENWYPKSNLSWLLIVHHTNVLSWL